MPVIFIVSVVAQILLGLHAVRTGRPQLWIYIIIFFPLIGGLIYLAPQVVPDFLDTWQGRLIRQNVGKAIDRNRDIRRQSRQMQISLTAKSKRQLAKACMERARCNEARQLYSEALQPPFETDPALLLGFARACEALGQYGGCARRAG